MSKIRLDRFIANNLNIPRKSATAEIRHGNVSVDGVIQKSGSLIIDTESDVRFKGQAVKYKKYVYILMYKPQGVLSASTDKTRETVIDLIPENLRRPNLFPVGRLDKDTTGLLLITDDGDFAHNCISPKKDISKCYIATLDGNIKNDMITEFEKGITLADGTKCKPAVLQIVEDNVARITVTEGKYHQIKRMFGTVGLGVDKLHRESIGMLKLPKNMLPGECIELNFTELCEKVINITQNNN